MRKKFPNEPWREIKRPTLAHVGVESRYCSLFEELWGEDLARLLLAGRLLRLIVDPTVKKSTKKRKVFSEKIGNWDNRSSYETGVQKIAFSVYNISTSVFVPLMRGSLKQGLMQVSYSPLCLQSDNTGSWREF